MNDPSEKSVQANLADDSNAISVGSIDNRDISMESNLMAIQAKFIVRDADKPITIYTRLTDVSDSISQEKTISTVISEATCVFASLKSEHTYNLIAAASGYVSCRKTISSGTTEITLELLKNPILSLRIVADGDIPVPGAQVEIRSTDHGIYAQNFLTTKEGIIQIELPRLGLYSIKTSHPRFNDVSINEIPIEYNPNELKLTLSGINGSIIGTVRNQNEESIENATLTLLQENGGTIIGKTRTDTNGRYALSDIKTGQYYLLCDAGKGYLQSDLYYSSSGKEDALRKRIVIDPDHNTRQIDFYVERALMINGVVRNEKGETVAHAEIRGNMQGQREYVLRPTGESTKSNESGEFTLALTKRVISWNTILLTAIHPDYEHGVCEIKNMDWRSNPPDATVILPEITGKLIGMVKDSDTDAPIAYKVLKILNKSAKFQPEFTKTIETGPQGQFELPIACGDYVFACDGYALHYPKQIYVKVGSIENVEILFKKEREADLTFSGKVVAKSDGTPIYNAGVYLTPLSPAANNARNSAHTFSAPDGTFKLATFSESIREDTELQIFHKNYQPFTELASKWNERERTTVEMEEFPCAIKVILSGVADDNGIRIYLKKGDQDDPVEFTKRWMNQVAVLDKIDPSKGPFTILAGNAEYIGISPIFDFNNSQSQYHEIVLPMKKREMKTYLYYQIVDANSGQPIPAARVEIRGCSLSEYAFPITVSVKTVTNADGMAEFKDMPLFVGEINVSHGLYKPFQQAIHHGAMINEIREFISLEKRNFQ
jgi:hypothetical protein